MGYKQKNGRWWEGREEDRKDGEEGKGKAEEVSKEGVKRRDRAMFCTDSLNSPLMEDMVGQPRSSHWRSEDTKAHSVHCDRCWGSHNG